MFRINSNNLVNVKNVNLCLRSTVYSTSTYFRLLHIQTGVHCYLYNFIYYPSHKKEMIKVITFHRSIKSGSLVF